MGRRRSAVVAAAWLALVLLASTIRAQGQTTTLSEYEALVRQWLDLKTELTQSAGQWREQQGILNEELRLLQAEKKRLSDLLAARQADVVAVERSNAAAVARQRQLQEATAALAAPLGQAEAAAKAWRGRVPEFLAAALPPEAEPVLVGAESPDADLAKRLQTVLGLYSEIEKLSMGVHEGRMVVKATDGTSREVDVLFLGLGAGFAVSRDGTLAGVSAWGEKGWEWQWRPDVAAPVRDALQVLRKERPAEFVRLPLRVQNP